MTKHKTKKCKHCNGTFTPKRSTAEYCKDSCRKSANRGSKKRPPKKMVKCQLPSCTNLVSSRKYCEDTDCKSKHTAEKQHKRNLTNFYESSFGYWIFDACRRSETVEVLKGWNGEILTKMRQLKARQFYANGLGNGGLHHFAHLAPVKGELHVGLFNPANLLLVERSINLKLGKQEFGHLERTPRNQLKERWSVKPDATPKQVLQLANKYLNGLLFDTAQSNPFSKRQKQNKVIPPVWDTPTTHENETYRMLTDTNDKRIRDGITKYHSQIHADSYDDFYDEIEIELGHIPNWDKGDDCPYSFDGLAHSVLTMSFQD